MSRRFLKLTWQVCLLCLVYISAVNYRLCIYLYHQGKGQLHILMNTQSIGEFKSTDTLSSRQLENLALIKQIKSYAEDSLGFVQTKNYERIYNQHHQPILWAVTVSHGNSLTPYYWNFPLIGSVSYKGFFEKEKACTEAYHYTAKGYDTEIRPVSAWSTLGWLNDPVLSSMLDLSKGSLCNLVFHELFHSTYYAPGSVDDNENLATFIGDKATIRFLKNDTTSLNHYLSKKQDNALFHHYIAQNICRLNVFYDQKPFDPVQKLRLLVRIAEGLDQLPFKDPLRFRNEKKDMLQFKNAYFIGFNQYHKNQDSLETAFNKIYRQNLRNMVLDLKQKRNK